LPGLPQTGPASAWAQEFYGSQVADTYARSGASGPLRTRLWPGLDALPDDLYVEKSASSAFFPGRCPLPELLGERDVETVLVAGTVASVCCESTARDASTLGYRVVMVADAIAGVDDGAVNATLRTIYRSFGDVRSTADALDLIARP
jgi:nicotinamidase-related amidase